MRLRAGIVLLIAFLTLLIIAFVALLPSLEMPSTR
jgi:hypothetical protein